MGDMFKHLKKYFFWYFNKMFNILILFTILFFWHIIHSNQQKKIIYSVFFCVNFFYYFLLFVLIKLLRKEFYVYSGKYWKDSRRPIVFTLHQYCNAFELRWCCSSLELLYKIKASLWTGQIQRVKFQCI